MAIWYGMWFLEVNYNKFSILNNVNIFIIISLFYVFFYIFSFAQMLLAFWFSRFSSFSGNAIVQFNFFHINVEVKSILGMASAYGLHDNVCRLNILCSSFRVSLKSRDTC